MEITWNIIRTSALTGVCTSILTTILTLRYTRKNLKTTKYIETIITERIKWINLLRDDFSILITSILVINNNIDKLHETQFESERSDYARHLTMRDEYEDDELFLIYENNRTINNINTALKKCLTPAEILIKITQIKLRLDLKKNPKISEILNVLIDEYSNLGCSSKDSKVDTSLLTELAQTMLTKEWNDIISDVNTK
jgi:hypothetical protein